MVTLNLSDISKVMGKLDICMMTTQSKGDKLTSRPMSNNGDVEYNGNSYFFSDDKAEVIKEIENNPAVNLSFQGSDEFYISISGKGKLITNKKTMQEHWTKSLNQWFKEGVETPGIIMIHVKASKIKYWHKQDEGEVKL